MIRGLGILFLTATFFLASSALLAQAEGCHEEVHGSLAVDPGHPWRPPFGLDRVGKLVTIAVELTAKKRARREYYLAGYRNGQETDRQVINVRQSRREPYHLKVPVTLSGYPTEVALFARCQFEGEPEELARKTVEWPAIDAYAAASPDQVTNPVDLGTILVPAGWLPLKAGQDARLDLAAVSYQGDINGAQVTARYASHPEQKATARIDLIETEKQDVTLRLPTAPPNVDHDELQVTLAAADGRELWRTKIQTMIFRSPPQWPRFGATETELRYDAPISVRDPATGELLSMAYEGAWRPGLKDVVVSLPNGARFVFWRGSSYVPFWAGERNTGLCYEWAETRPPPEGFQDSVEPLMDKELRYGRVRILESTAARVHVRWSYQANDFEYRVFGDSIAEDFYFYPDGFGTRVVTLRSKPDTPYELSEFIILTPQGTYPFSVFPRVGVTALFLDGHERAQAFPARGSLVDHYVATKPGDRYSGWDIGKRRGLPALYRVRPHKDETKTVVYFSANPDHPRIVFGPFHDRGYMVTPAYWGSHWPLGRGSTTSSAIDGRVRFTPAHNSLMSFGINEPIQPTPISEATFETIDKLGRSKRMSVRRWAWLIGMTDASDHRLLEWAHSFSRPPSVELKGARLAFDSYVPERRSTSLVVEDEIVSIVIKPTVKCINPVFELSGVPGDLGSVSLGGRHLQPAEYAWDGATLWVKADIEEPRELRLEFTSGPR